MKDIHSIYLRVNSLRPVANNATVNSTGVDLANVLENKIEIVVGTITDGTHTPTLQESADNATWTAVAAANMVGSFSALASNTDQSVGYIGSLRYVRVNMVVAGATTGGVYSIGAQVKYRRQS